jgi:hypothetical protein
MYLGDSERRPSAARFIRELVPWVFLLAVSSGLACGMNSALARESDREQPRLIATFAPEERESFVNVREVVRSGN